MHSLRPGFAPRDEGKVPPGEQNRSNMPNSVEAVTSGTARMATLILLSGSVMAEMNGFLRF